MNEKYSNIYLQTLLTLAFLQELMDELSGTSAYNHSLKQAAKRLQSELDRIINRDMFCRLAFKWRITSGGLLSVAAS